MGQPLISVVMPVYNVEPYLRRCIKSVCEQTYSPLEIILVDDGSTDNCGTICDEAANEDKRIKVIHKANGGLSDARNVGVKAATGEYVTFIDSDDSIDAEMIGYLYYLIQKYGTDMSLCSHTVVFEGEKKSVLGKGGEECLPAETCIRKMLYHQDVDTSAWAKLYKREIFSDIAYPVGKQFEDIGTTYKTFIKSKMVACGYRSLYNYYVRKSSIVRSSFSEKKLDLLEMTDAMGREVQKKYPSLEKAVLRRRLYARFSTLNQMENVSGYDKEKHEIINFIRENASKVFWDASAPLRDKLAIICILLGENFYFKMWNIVK